MIVETAFALPLLITLMVGMVSYGVWLMAALSVQDAANHAARAALAGNDNGERRQLVTESIAHGVLSEGIVDPALVQVSTSLDGTYYTVTVTYDIAASGVFTSGAIPLPDDTIRRSAVVRLGSF